MIKEWEYELRLLLAGILFIAGFYLVWDLVSNGLNIFVFIGVVVCFVLGYFIMPNLKKEADKYFLVDAWDWVQYRAIAPLLRAIGKADKRDFDNINF